MTKLHVEERANRAAASFLQIDSEAGLTFSGIALHTDDSEKRRRNARIARQAYDTIVRLRQDFDLTEAETDKLDQPTVAEKRA